MLRILLVKLLFFIISIFPFALLAQEDGAELDNITQYEEEVKQMVSFLQYSMNVLGDPSFSAKEKDVVINESYTKIFASEKVQVEDDLDANRDVVTNKDVQAYLKDVDFFFKQVKFEFNIIDIDHSENHEGKLFFTVKMMRSLKGVTVENDSMNNDLERYIEVNVDEENKDLKIASIYTTKLSRDQELTYWWAGLSREWKTILGVDIVIREGLRLNDIQEFSDSTYIVNGQEIVDSVRIINYVKKAADKTELDLSGSYLVQNLKPLNQLKSLAWLDISGSSIKDIFPIRNITTLNFLDCSNTMIEDLSPLRYSKSLKELIITNTPVTSITVVENFENLEVLKLEHTVIDSLPSIDGLAHLKELYCGSTNLESLDSLKLLASLEVLDCSNTAISDINPIVKLSNLRKLNISKTQVNSLESLKSLKSLEELTIENTNIEDISAIATLTNLKFVYADNSKVSEAAFLEFSEKNQDADSICMSDVLHYFWNGLGPDWKEFFSQKLQFSDSVSNLDLHKILKIRSIDINGKERFVDLAPLKHCMLLEELDFSGTPVPALGPVLEMKKLKKINGARSQIVVLNGLGQLPDLKVINFEGTGVASIAGLSGLKDVDTLIFNNTSVGDLSILNEIGPFRIAYFDNTAVADEDVLHLNFDEDESVLVYKSEKLRTWWGNMEDKWQDLFIEKWKLSERPNSEELHQLTASRSIEVNSTSIRNIDPVPEFIRLESLVFSETRVNSLYPLSGLQRLKTLKCPRNPISEIDPISSITTLEVLDLNNTQVSKLDPIRNLSNLKELTFSGTNVKDLSPIEGLQNLEVLDFSKTKVRQVKALDNLSNLKTLNCYNNKISDKRIEEFRLKNPDCEVVFY